MTTQTKLWDLRDRLGVGIMDFSRMLGVAVSSIYRWEATGKEKMSQSMQRIVDSIEEAEEDGFAEEVVHKFLRGELSGLQFYREIFKTGEFVTKNEAQ